ncbi:MAG: 5-formyltetrahydrofolate cyclo-ligase [Pseudomonadota bacterium]
MTREPRIPCDGAALPALAEQKLALRKELLARRRALDPALKAAWDARIAAHLLAWRRDAQAAVIGVYWPLAGEPDLMDAYDALAREGVRLALPVVLERDAPLGFADWVPGEAMMKDAMGVAVPQLLRAVVCPPVLLVPCLGFNGERFRLGYGGGYYDRTLALMPRPVTVGVAYASLAAEFASAAHDVALDFIITEAA